MMLNSRRGRGGEEPEAEKAKRTRLETTSAYRMHPHKVA